MDVKLIDYDNNLMVKIICQIHDTRQLILHKCGGNSAKCVTRNNFLFCLIKLPP